MLTLPASTYTAKRSFSRLRRLKTYLRSGMKQQRLNFVAIINAHKKETKALSIATLIDDFVCQTSVRKYTFYSTKLRPDVPVIYCFIRIFCLQFIFFIPKQLINKFYLTAKAFVKKVD